MSGTILEMTRTSMSLTYSQLIVASSMPKTCEAKEDKDRVIVHAAVTEAVTHHMRRKAAAVRGRQNRPHTQPPSRKFLASAATRGTNSSNAIMSSVSMRLAARALQQKASI